MIESHMDNDTTWAVAPTEKKIKKKSMPPSSNKPPEPDNEKKDIGFIRKYLWLHISTVIAFALLISLGSWQMKRLSWKENLIELAKYRVSSSPVFAPGPEDWGTIEMAEVNYLPVQVTGQFLLGELYYYENLSNPRGMQGGQGFFVYAPFITNQGWAVLVNRGFVPMDQKNLSSRLTSLPIRGEVTINGLIRRPETPSFFSADADLEKKEWFVREPLKMAEALGLDRETTAPYTIDATDNTAQAGSLPQAGETRLSFTNNHLSYALTWFGLAVTLLAVYGALLVRLRKEFYANRDKLSPEDEQDLFFQEEEAARKAAIERKKANVNPRRAIPNAMLNPRGNNKAPPRKPR